MVVWVLLKNEVKKMFIENRELDIAIAKRKRDEIVSQRQSLVAEREEIQKQLDLIDDKLFHSIEEVNKLENSSEVPILMFHIDESLLYTSRKWPFDIEYHIDAYKNDIYYLPEHDRLYTKRYIPEKHKDFYQNNQKCLKKSGIEFLPNTIDMRKYFSEFIVPGHKEYFEPSFTDRDSINYIEIQCALDVLRDKIKSMIAYYGIETAQDFRDVIYELMDMGEFNHLEDDYYKKLEEEEVQENNLTDEPSL